MYDERTEEDPVRFAGLKPLKATIQVDVSQGKSISDHLIGIFLRISIMRPMVVCMPNWCRTVILNIHRKTVRVKGGTATMLGV